MFYHKWLKRIFPSQGYLGIRLYPTNICDTGCRHCIEDSGMKKAFHFQASMARAIVKEARWRRWDLSVLITGGGEPLLCQNLEEIVQIFKSYERLSFFFINTSGFLREEEERERRFRAIFCDKEMSRHIGLSFNLYHPSFPERLANVAEALMAMHDKNFLMLRACVSCENAKETNRQIEKNIKEIAARQSGKHFYLPIGHGWDGRACIGKIHSLLEEGSYGPKQASKLMFEGEIAEHWHAIKNERGGLVIMLEHYSLIPEGRALRLCETPYSNTYCPEIECFNKQAELTIDADGLVYPEQSCHGDKNMNLGRIGQDQLAKMLMRKQVFREKITKALLGDKRRFVWGSREMCLICRQISYQEKLLR